jgi:predicted DNA-binding protein (MmcQ/YjbR family)
MDVAALRARCGALPGVTAEHPFGPGALVMKVGGGPGRIFAIIGEDSERPTISLKCEPGLAVLLRDAYDAVVTGYHLNKRHWNTVTVDGSVPDDELRAWIEDSYDLVVAGLPRAQRAALER